MDGKEGRLVDYTHKHSNMNSCVLRERERQGSILNALGQETPQPAVGNRETLNHQ